MDASGSGLQQPLDAQVSAVVAAIRRGEARAGLVACVEARGAALSSHFPGTAHDVNELANVTRQR